MVPCASRNSTFEWQKIVDNAPPSYGSETANSTESTRNLKSHECLFRFPAAESEKYGGEVVVFNLQKRVEYLGDAFSETLKSQNFGSCASRNWNF